ncbi:MAG: hypothetical protein M3O31_08755 [Acidobacteriota bacterium]|nr:hypothetical protein [Acidobacteriota bacterium]
MDTCLQEGAQLLAFHSKSLMCLKYISTAPLDHSGPTNGLKDPMAHSSEYEQHFDLITLRNEWFWKGVIARTKQLEGGGHPISESEKVGLRREFLREHLATSGRVEGSDVSPKAIRAIVDDDPNISVRGLCKRLASSTEINFLNSSDLEVARWHSATQIRFVGRDGVQGVMKISKLKDLLARAKASRAKRLARGK